MICKICHNESTEHFSTLVLGKYNVRYYLYGTCSFLQTEEPYWLPEAYRYTIIASDTGSQPAVYISQKSSVPSSLWRSTRRKFLDYGGLGPYTRLVRDIGFDYYWSDPFTQNPFMKGFEHRSAHSAVEIVTSPETLKHFSDSMDDIDHMAEAQIKKIAAALNEARKVRSQLESVVTDQFRKQTSIATGVLWRLTAKTHGLPCF